MKTRKTGTGEARLSWFQSVCYGAGYGGRGITFTLLSSFLLVYYTNVLRMDPAVAASIIAISRVFDATTDLFMGYLVDRTNTRLGKARPWLLRFVLPAMLCMIATFTVPASLAGTAQIVYVFASYNLFVAIFVTGVEVSYNSLNSLITNDQYERGVNSILAMIFYTLVMLIINTTMLQLCTAFGGGELYSQKGWTSAVAVIAVVYGICIMVTFLTVREIGAQSEEKEKAQNKVNPIRIVGMLFSNKYWVLYVLALVAVNVSSGILMGVAVFYSEYILGDVYAFSSISTAVGLSMLLGVIVSLFLIKKLGKRNTALIGFVILIGGTLFAGVMPQTVTNAVIAFALRGFGAGIPSALGAGILQDTLTYGKWKTGVDMVGMGNAGSSFVLKVATGLGTGIIGWVLSVGGFIPAAATQSESALAAIMSLLVWIPLGSCIFACICFILYKLDKEYPQYLEDLKNGKYGPKAIVPATEQEEV